MRVKSALLGVILSCQPFFANAMDNNLVDQIVQEEMNKFVASFGLKGQPHRCMPIERVDPYFTNINSGGSTIEKKSKYVFCLKDDFSYLASVVFSDIRINENSDIFQTRIMTINVKGSKFREFFDNNQYELICNLEGECKF